MKNNCQGYDFGMESLLLSCNKPFHFCSKSTTQRFFQSTFKIKGTLTWTELFEQMNQIFLDCNRFNKGEINEVRIEWTITEYRNKTRTKLTQWNIKLVFHYSKSVSHENSKCLHFPSVQMKHIAQNRLFFSHPKQNYKMSPI